MTAILAAAEVAIHERSCRNVQIRPHRVTEYDGKVQVYLGMSHYALNSHAEKRTVGLLWIRGYSGIKRNDKGGWVRGNQSLAVNQQWKYLTHKF